MLRPDLDIYLLILARHMIFRHDKIMPKKRICADGGWFAFPATNDLPPTTNVHPHLPVFLGLADSYIAYCSCFAIVAHILTKNSNYLSNNSHVIRSNISDYFRSWSSSLTQIMKPRWEIGALLSVACFSSVRGYTTYSFPTSTSSSWGFTTASPTSTSSGEYTTYSSYYWPSTSPGKRLLAVMAPPLCFCVRLTVTTPNRPAVAICLLRSSGRPIPLN